MAMFSHSIVAEDVNAVTVEAVAVDAATGAVEADTAHAMAAADNGDAYADATGFRP